jgi:hypothetical protein
MKAFSSASSTTGLGTQPPTVEIPPSQFLSHLSSKPPCSDQEGPFLIVSGDVDLKKLPAHAPSRVNISGCRIRGNLLARGEGRLESVNCQVDQSVDLHGSAVKTTGSNFLVGGNLDVEECRHLRVLRGHIAGNVDACASGLVEVPCATTIGGSLDVRDCRRLDSVNCTLKGGLTATRSSLRILGENFRCNADLDLRDCPRLEEIGFVGTPQDVSLVNSGLVTITDGFSCSGSVLVASSPRLKCIGEARGVKIGGNLVVSDCKKLQSIAVLRVGLGAGISSCPSLRRVAGAFGGTVSLSKCSLEELTAELKVDGELLAELCPFLKNVASSSGSNVHLSDLLSLEKIEEQFFASGNVEVTACPTLSEIQGKVGGDLFLRGPLRLDRLDAHLQLGGCLRVSAPGLVSKKSTARPSSIGQLSISLPGSVELNNVRIGSLSSSFACSSLSAISTIFDGNLGGMVYGDASFTECQIENISASFECAGSLCLENCEGGVKLNCTIGGAFRTIGPSAPEFLPAFSSAR